MLPLPWYCVLSEELPNARSSSPGRVAGKELWSCTKRVAGLVATDELDVDHDRKQKQQRVVDLRRDLQEAEVDESLSEVVATVRVLKSTNGDEGITLGPTLSACVEFEGSPIEALLDNGSPVTIVSMRFLLEALAKQKLKEQDPMEWAAAVKSRLEPPSLTLHNYGGDELKVVRQLTVTISKEGHTCTATVLVLKDAPLDLLLGTDLQTQLGFLFLQKKTNGTAVDLLQKRKWALIQTDHEPEEEPVLPSCSKDYKTEEDNPLDAIDIDVEESPVVCLIQAARLPSRHVKLVRTRVLDYQARGARVFESEKEALREKGLVIEDAAVKPNENRYVMLAIHNRSLHTARLEGNHILGCLQEATVFPTPSFAEDEWDCTVRAVQTTPLPGEPDQNVNCEADVDWMTQLLKKLNWDSPVLTVEQKHQLKELLLQNGDLFVLSPSELGVTNVVQHTINTGDSTPMDSSASPWNPFCLTL